MHTNIANTTLVHIQNSGTPTSLVISILQAICDAMSLYDTLLDIDSTAACELIQIYVDSELAALSQQYPSAIDIDLDIQYDDQHALLVVARDPTDSYTMSVCDAIRKHIQQMVP